MGNYISSNANRFYAAIENSYGQAAPITASSRFPAVKLQAHQVLAPGRRMDKTGSRTFRGFAASSRRHTAFDVRTYLTSWNGLGEPSYGPLFQAGLGAVPQTTASLVVAQMTGLTQIQTTTPHGLVSGGAVSFGGEIRFVTSTPDESTVILNAPFSQPAAVNSALAPAISYNLATALPSVSIYDFWDPITAVSRFVTGAAVDVLGIAVNGDFHEFTFSGPAADLLDSTSFAPGSAGISTFPAEPAPSVFDYSIVPGHLGQAWLGNTANRFFTLTAASIQVKNHISVRNQEFGSSYPTAIAPGPREIASSFTLMAQDDAQTSSLYAAAKQRTTVSAMLQLGQQQGSLMGIFLPSVTPELPAYNDSDIRLHWQFSNNLAQGSSNNEIYIAFA
jgi:hypothetical protein